MKNRPKISCCKLWETELGKINSYIQIQFIRTGKQYTGVPFKYCPWCGKKKGSHE